MSNSEQYADNISLARKRIEALPTGEIKYYLFLLLASLQPVNNKKTQRVLDKLLELLQDLNHFHSNPCQLHNSKFLRDYEQLVTIAQTHTLPANIKTALLDVVGVLVGFYLAIIGGLIGGVAGFVRGCWHYKPFYSAAIGVTTGILMGAMIGFRTPKKLFRQELQRQLKYSLDGVGKCINEQSLFSKVKATSTKKVADYEREIGQEMLALFNNNQEAYQTFLNQNQTYYIRSLKSTFIGEPLLAGYIGHHAYIRFDLAQREKPFLLEFAPEDSDLVNNEITQEEKREVTGKKLIEMMAFHRKLQETYKMTIPVMLSIKPGDTDCLNYVDKIMVGTNQKTTTLQRFKDMTAVGEMTSKVFKKLSPFKPGFFNVIEGRELIVKSASESVMP